MAMLYGYCYDKDGRFTEIIPIPEKPIYEKQTSYREDMKEVVTEEKLCEVHQKNEDGKFDCPNCVMHKVEYVPIKVPYEEDVIVGYEPDIPINCTLEVCPDLIYDPVFKDGKWIKLKPELPPQPEPGPSEMDKLKTELEVTKAAMAEFIMQQTLKGMGM
ncbi:hypothetical protein ABHP49_005419 [Bacillus cereus]